MEEALTEHLNFEKVWALFKEGERKMEQEAELRKQEAERWQQNFDRMTEEYNRRSQETDRKISKLGSRIGQLIEHLAASNILEKFRELGYVFTRISRDHRIRDEQNRILAEIDLLLENGDYAMAVEVKSLLSPGDVKEHLKRMQTLRTYADKRDDKRKYAGAVTGALIEDAARDYALESGLYVVEQTGDTVRIRKPGTPKTW